jgi:hypothetical protein
MIFSVDFIVISAPSVEFPVICGTGNFAAQNREYYGLSVLTINKTNLKNENGDYRNMI